MKISKLVINILTAIIFTGALLLSCEENNNGSVGTLVIEIPGSSAARAAGDSISDEFKSTLKYHVICTGSGNEEEIFEAGKSVVLFLNSGQWIVSVNVLNAADMIIGEGESRFVNIESGKTSTIKNLKINIETHHCDITDFKILSSSSVDVSKIETHVIEDNICFYIPSDVDIYNKDLSFTLTHTGKKIEYYSYSGNPDAWKETLPTKMPFILPTGTGDDDLPTIRKFRVYPENGNEPKYYYVVEGKKALEMFTKADWGGFDIISKGYTFEGSTWDGKIFEFTAGDTIEIKGKFNGTLNNNIELRMGADKNNVTNTKTISKNGDGSFSETKTIGSDDVAAINNGVTINNNGISKIDPLAIRVKMSSAGTVIIEQVLIKRGSEVLLDFSKHLQTLELKEYIDDDIKILFDKNKALVDAGGTGNTVSTYKVISLPKY